jgi:hypothetical protein
MLLVYIENKDLMSQIITYLDIGKVSYTTNTKEPFTSIIIAQTNKKTNKLISNCNRIIYIAYEDEYKMYISESYRNHMLNFFTKCTLVVTSIPYFNNIISNNEIINKENICIGKCKNKFFSFKKESIAIIDLSYKYITKTLNIIRKNEKENFLLIGYESEEKLTKEKIKALKDLPKNVKLIKYTNSRIIQNQIENSAHIIFLENILKADEYLNVCLNMKKNIILLDSPLCEKYLIDNKNAYLVNTNNLNKVLNKVLLGRVSKLGSEAYELVINGTAKEISDKLCKLVK